MRRNTSVTGPVGAGIAYRPSAFVTAPNAVPVMDTLTPAIGSLVVADVTRPVIWRCCADAPATPTSVASASVSRRMRVTTIPPEGIPRSSRHGRTRSEEHTSELQSQSNLVCRLLLEKEKISKNDAP